MSRRPVYSSAADLLIGKVDLLQLLLRFRLKFGIVREPIRMPYSSHLAISLLYVFQGSAWFDFKSLIAFGKGALHVDGYRISQMKCWAKP